MIRFNTAAMIIIAIALTAAAGIVGGCSTSLNPQQYSGINKAVIAFDKGQPDEILIWGGKEQEGIKVRGEVTEGVMKFEYEAAGVQAFDGVRARAEVAKAIAETIGDVAPGVVDAITKAALCGAGAVAAC